MELRKAAAGLVSVGHGQRTGRWVRRESLTNIDETGRGSNGRGVARSDTRRRLPATTRSALSAVHGAPGAPRSGFCTWRRRRTLVVADVGWETSAWAGNNHAHWPVNAIAFRFDPFIRQYRENVSCRIVYHLSDEFTGCQHQTSLLSVCMRLCQIYHPNR